MEHENRIHLVGRVVGRDVDGTAIGAEFVDQHDGACKVTAGLTMKVMWAQVRLVFDFFAQLLWQL